jgi:hypothetical protein
MDTKAQIQELISLGKTEEALELLSQLSTDAVLLQSRFNGAKRQYSMGLIDFSEWSRTQSQINYAALEMMSMVKEEKKGLQNSGQGPNVPEPSSTPSIPKVFISYNHDDFFAMQSIKSHLESNGIKVIVDTEEIKPGERFEDFITRALRDNAFILTIVSKNSLLSGWVSKELTASLLLNHLSQRQWIPVRIDNEMFDAEFFFSANSKIEARITSLREAIQKSLEARLDIRSFTEELARQEDLKNNFSRILADLKSRLVIDVTGPLFRSGMDQVIQTIKNT